jgi:hypothetical protein
MPPNFELLRVAADEGPLVVFGLVGVRGPAPAVVNSKDGRGPAAVLAATSTGAFAAELVARWADEERPMSMRSMERT